MIEFQERYVNPLTDFGFKKLFGSEPNKELLIDFLNQILPDRKIKDLTYSSGEKPGHTAHERKAVFDLFCTGENGERFIVEMQKAKQNYFKDRSVYYASFPIQEQGVKSDWDFKLSHVYTVGILDFTFDENKNDKEVLHTVELKDQNCKVFYDKLKFIYIELPKFNKTEEELETQFDKWLYVFKHLARLKDRPKALQERVFAKLFAAAEIAKFSRKERKAYEQSLKSYLDLKNTIETARTESKEEGKIEERVEMAKKLKESGVDLQIIVQVTGLSKEEIKNLK